MNFLKMYLIAFLVFLIVDAIWLSFVANQFYKKHIGFLMKTTPNYLAALLFYLVFIVGLVFFVVQPAVNTGDVGRLILGAALFGFITYATYDLTNLATIRDWPLIVTVVDLAWGTVLSTTISVASYYLYLWIF